MMRRLLAILALALLLAGCGRDDDKTTTAEPSSDKATDAVATEVEAIASATFDEAAAIVANAPDSTELCVGCHGATAPSPFSDMATIQGLPIDAIENALYDFRAGTRPCRKSACSAEGACPDLDMCMVTADLDDEAIGVLASWFSSLPFVAADQAFAPERAGLGEQIHQMRCESCHSDGGVAPIEQANRLRGQHKAYLRLALEQYRSGERMAVGMMDSSVKALSADEIDALLEYYASPID